ncbi:hypothetical protein ACFL6G_04105 [candidate division KSB1 bacterium]
MSDMRFSEQTCYIPLLKGIGVTHHETGLGKLKVYDKENKTEYAVPLVDIDKPMSQ